MDVELLRKFSEGLICLSACLGGMFSTHCSTINMTRLKIAIQFNEIFGQGNFYLELQHNGIEEQKIVNQGILKLSKETGIPLVATNDVHYLKDRMQELKKS